MEQTKEIRFSGFFSDAADSLTAFICHDRIVNVGIPVGSISPIKTATGERERGNKNSRESLTFY